MKCLRCGHCCINYEVMIVNDPTKGVCPDNIIYKPSGTPCQHLKGDKPGEYFCGIHDYSWYEETPCFQFSQIEKEDSNCRMGEHLLSQNLKEKVIMGDKQLQN